MPPKLIEVSTISMYDGLIKPAEEMRMPGEEFVGRGKGVHRFGMQIACLVLAIWLMVLPRDLRAASGYTDLYTLTVPGLHSSSYGDYHPIVGGVTAGSAFSDISHSNHAILWTSMGQVDLHPIDSSGSKVESGDGLSQVGAINGHAAVWIGYAGAFVILDQGGYSSSDAYGFGGGQQVGYGSNSGGTFALLWSGSAGSVVNLNPPQYFSSQANGTDGTRQVGYSLATSTSPPHATLWAGSAASYIDLHPTNNLRSFYSSVAVSISGNQEVGYGFPTLGGNPHAMLWSSSADSAVDLTPPTSFGEGTFLTSRAYGTDGTHQVGWGEATSYLRNHARYWSGSASSAIDLGSILPDGWDSSAYSISGNTVYGIAIDTNGIYHGIAWAVPEPSAPMPLSIAGVALLRRSRRVQ